MSTTTDRDPAGRSKVAASVLSAGAVFAIVTGLNTAAQDRPPATAGGALAGAGTIQPSSPTAPVEVATPAASVAPAPRPAPVPAPVPAVAPPTRSSRVPDAVSRASGG